MTAFRSGFRCSAVLVLLVFTGAPVVGDDPTGAAVISEVLASNLLGVDDFQGDSSDWFEIHNTSATDPLDLTGWYVTDDPRALQQWAIPAGTIVDPDDYIVIFASGKDLTDNQLHTNFELGSDGEYLALVCGDEVVHEYAPEYPPQFRDVSYGIPVPAGEPTYLATPTPGRENSGPASLGPTILDVTHTPALPAPGDDIVITADVAPLFAPVDSVSLVYRVLYAAESDALEMNDEGTGADVTAGDGIYSGVIPSGSFGAGDMVRWFVTAADSAGDESRSPRFPDPRASAEYHGVVVDDPSRDTALPVFSWFLRPGTEGAANTRSGTRTSVSFLGQLYDNAFVRIRGGSTTGLAKKSYKFDFNPGDHFRFDPEFGRVSEINLNTTYTDKTYVRQPLSYEIFDAAGCPGSESFLVRVERGGEFFSIAAFIEQPDDDLLRREGLDDEGALYKMFNNFTSASSAEKKTRRYENRADLQSFISSMNGLSGARLHDYVFDNVDIPAMLAYLGGNALTQNNDCMAKNYYVYRDTEGSGEWLALPWDVDLTFGRHFMTNDNILGDPLWSDEDYVLGGRQRNVPISPSHPLMGIQELPGNRNWNRLIDALFEVPEFREMFRRRLRTLIDQILQTADTPEAERWIESRIATMAEQMGEDAGRDVDKWGQYGARQTLSQAIDFLEAQYLGIRRTHSFETHLVDNVDSYPEPRAFSTEIPGPQLAVPPIEIVEIEHSPATGNQDEEYIVLRNPNGLAVDISGWRLEGGARHTFKDGTVLLSGATLHVTPDAGAFRARTESPTGGEGLFVQGDYAGHLSNIGETVCLVAPDGTEVACESYEGEPTDYQLFLRVTEVHYHPADPSAAEQDAGFTDDDEFEFVELVNLSDTVTLDLTDVRFTGGIEFDFSESAIPSLPPGGVALVVASPEAFAERYGLGMPIAGGYSPSRLRNGGETVKLEDPLNQTILEFTYDDDPDAGWPTAPDGSGPSLEIVDSSGDYDDPANWRASEADHGTPGQHDSLGGGERFIRGDANLDGSANIADAVHMLLYLFSSGEATCRDALDVNDDETLNITDPIRLLGHLFQGGEMLPSPYPAAGSDPSDDGPLDCEVGLR